MRIIFDHSTPKRLIPYLQGHSVSTAIECGWDRLENGDLLTAAENAGFDLLLTADKNMRYQFRPKTWRFKRCDHSNLHLQSNGGRKRAFDGRRTQMETIHIFSAPSNGESHWNGPIAGAKPIRLEDVPIGIRRAIQ